MYCKRRKLIKAVKYTEQTNKNKNEGNINSIYGSKYNINIKNQQSTISCQLLLHLSLFQWIIYILPLDAY